MREFVPVYSSKIIRHIYAEEATARAGKTALAYGDITAYYVRAGGTLTALTLETIATLGTWASTGDNKLGFKLLHDTNAPGMYELDLPNNLFATGSNLVTIQLRATGMAPVNLGIPINQSVWEVVFNGTPTATVLPVSSLPDSLDDDTFIGRVLVIETGVRKGQAATISDFNGTAKTITVEASALTGAPAAGDVARIH